MWKKGCSGFMNRRHSEATKTQIAKKITEHVVSNDTKSNMSISQIKRFAKNPEAHPRGMLGKHHTQTTREQMIRSHIKRFLEHPEESPNYVLARNGGLSKSQMKMFEIVKAEVGEIEVSLNHYVRTSKTFRFIDVAIPSLKLGFEFDGTYWHQNISKDKARDKELTDQGWTIAHINEDGLKYLARGKHVGRTMR